MSINLPHNIAAERCVIGSTLANNKLTIDLIENLTSEDFFDELNQKIIRAIFNNRLQNKSIDPIILHEELKTEDCYLKANGLEFLEQLKTKFAKEKIDEYIDITKRHSESRLRIKLYAENQLALLDSKPDASEIISKNDLELVKLRSKNSKFKLKKISEIVDNPLKKAYQNASSDKKFTGIRTYFDIDMLNLGIQDTDEFVIAAESSIGKTALLLSIIANIIRFEPEKVIVLWSLEMSEEQIQNRLMAILAYVNPLNIISGVLTKEEWIRLNLARKMLLNSNLYINEQGGIKPSDIYTDIQRLLMMGIKPDLAAIDYINLMKSDYRMETKNLEVASIANSIKNNAKEFHIPFIVLSQLSRPQGTTSRKPDVHRLRDSGVILEACDTLCLIDRPEVYDNRPENFGKAQAIIAKNRNGPIGEIDLAYIKQYTRFLGVQK